MDRFKQQIREHAADWTLSRPSAKVKERILEHFYRKRQRVLLFYKTLAAASLAGMVMLSVVMLKDKETKQAGSDIAVNSPTDIKNKQPIEKDQPIITLVTKRSKKIGKIPVSIRTGPRSASDTGFNELMNSYTSFIVDQKNELERLPVYAGGNFLGHYREAFQQLNEREKKIKSLIVAFGMNKIYLDQLISCYQAKLSILTSLKLEIHRVNGRVMKDSILTNEPHYINL